MKKFFYVLTLSLTAALFATSAKAQTVDNFDDFNAALSVSSPSYTIVLSSDIVVAGALNAVEAGDLAINGNGFSIDGNAQNTGFTAETGKILSFSNIDLKNFSLSSSSDSLGGAVYNKGVLNIISSTMSHNSAKNDSQDANSGAYGGALYNSGTAVSMNSSFLYNSASNINLGSAKGGAVFNEGTFDVIADGADAEFTGNKAAGASNAVHNANNAEMNLNAATSDKIIFNDAVTGDNGIININKQGDWDMISNPGAPDGNKIPLTAPAAGTVVFNNSVTGNDINLYSGTLKLGVFNGIKDPADSSVYLAAASRGGIGSRSARNSFAIHDGAVLDMANGLSDDIVYVSTFTVESGTSNIKMDVDLVNRRSDKIDISQSALGNGKLSFYGMNILNDFQIGISADITVFTDTATMTVNYLDEVNFVTYGSSGVYRITQGADNRSLNFLLTEYTYDPFQHAVSTQSGARSYNLPKDYNAAANYDSLVATGTLYIVGAGEDGKAVTIYGNKVSNIFNVADTNTVINISNLVITDAKAEEGGAIYNSGTAVVSKTAFKDNVASSTQTAAKGGAIYNENILNIYDSSFSGNIAVGTGAAGGAIFSNGGVVNIVAESSGVVFQGNKVENISNAIHASGGAKLNLNALSGRTIYMYDSITSDGDNNILNINATTSNDSSVITSTESKGAVYLNADMSKFGNVNSSTDNVVNFYDGVIKFGQQTVFFNDVTFNMRAGSRIDMTNGKIDKISVLDLNLPDTGKAYLNIEADLRNAKADNLIGTKLNDDTGDLIIDKIVIVKDVKNLETKVSIEIADDAKLKNALSLNSAKEEIMGPVFTYFATYGDGYLNFEHTFDFNPAVFIAPITLQTGGYLGQLNSYDQAFSIIDKAISEEGVKGLWVRPYAYNEDVKLNKRLTISNTAYGAYAGYNSAPADLGREVSGVFTLYGAYNASDQSYTGTTITQGGGLLGATAVFFKEHFYAAFTANLGVVNEHGESKYGKDNFMMYTKGIALRSGYNFALDEYRKYTLQPSLDFSYSIMEIAPYKNTAGVKVDVGNFNPINVEPGIKLIADFESNLMSFISVSGNWSLNSDTSCTADDITLPEMSIEPYVQYGIGFEKAFTERLFAGAELYGRSLGRMGVGGQLSLRWNF